METVTATSLSNKISSFLHQIPGTNTVCLDFPTVQILVHGLPTDRSLPDIAQELITFTLAWPSPAHHAGSHLTTIAPPSASPLSSSPSLDPGHGTLLRARASLSSQQYSRLNTTSASTDTPSAMAATSMAITLYAAPTHPAAAGVLALTLRGTIPFPPPHATRRVAPADTPGLSVSHVPALTKCTLPNAPSVPPLSPVSRVGRVMRCISTGGLPLPLSLIFGGCYSYFVSGKGGLVLSHACNALHDGGGPTS